MTHTSPVEDELNDAVVCARCEHPIWDPRVSDVCPTCASHDHKVATSLFLLNDFTAAPQGE